jgi:hypothetical protein
LACELVASTRESAHVKSLGFSNEVLLLFEIFVASK